jgi:hypothetical protein
VGVKFVTGGEPYLESVLSYLESRHNLPAKMIKNIELRSRVGDVPIIVVEFIPQDVADFPQTDAAGTP